MSDVTRRVDWHEDIERPGTFVPDEPVVVRSGDSFTLTQTLVGKEHAGDLSDFTALPWAEGCVRTKAGGAS